jgi:hypothetical protein
VAGVLWAAADRALPRAAAQDRRPARRHHQPQSRAACYRCPWTDPLPMSPDRTAPAPNVALQQTRYAGMRQRGPRVHLASAPWRTHGRAAELGR